MVGPTLFYVKEKGLEVISSTPPDKGEWVYVPHPWYSMVGLNTPGLGTESVFFTPGCIPVPLL
jgi:hypothetical protein